MWVGKCRQVDADEHLEMVFHRISRVWLESLGSREEAEHAAVHDPLEVARAVVRWRGSDYEDIIEGAGGLQSDGLCCCAGAVGWPENEDEMWGDHGIPRDIPGPR